MMRPVAIAYGRALRSQFAGRMLLLSIVPLLLSLALWGGLLYAGMQPLLDWLHALFADYGLFETSGSILATLGLGFLKTLVIPLVAMLVLLPLMIITSLLFIGVGAMPAIARHVSRVQFPTLERKEGETRAATKPIERFYWPLALAIVCLIMAWLLRPTSKRPFAPPASAPSSSRRSAQR